MIELQDDLGAMGVDRVGQSPEARQIFVVGRSDLLGIDAAFGIADRDRADIDQPSPALRPFGIVGDETLAACAVTGTQPQRHRGMDNAVAQFHRADPSGLQQIDQIPAGHRGVSAA